MSVNTMQVPRGLDGVVVDETAICLPEKGVDRLYYRGYAIEEVARCTYDEVVGLLITGEWPTATQVEEYRSRCKALRELPQALRTVLELIPGNTDPMEMLRTACSMLGNLEPETKERSLLDIGARLSASVPGILAYWHHYHRSAGRRIDTRTDEPDVAGHWLHLLHGTKPQQAQRRAMEVSLIVYAEHDFNASTFAARVATSTLSDAWSAIVAAIGTLRGPLHGSANAAVLRFLRKLTSPDQAEARVIEMLSQKARVPGFGQRAYAKSDPRNALNRAVAKTLAENAEQQRLYDIAERVETVLMRERGMFANLDYYTALIYDACGLPMELFPPMFFLARIPGLIAHIGEQRSNNRLIHPSSKYIGRAARPVPNAGQLASASHTAETS